MKRNLLLILTICILTSAMYTVVYANTSSGHFEYNVDVEKIRECVNSHTNFSVVHNGGIDYYVYDINGYWILNNGMRLTDSQVMSIVTSDNPMTNFALNASRNINSFYSLICQKIGYIPNDITSMYGSIKNISNYTLSSCSVDSNGNYNLSESFLKEFKAQLEQNYYESIGCKYIPSSGKPSDVLPKVSDTYVDEDEYNADLRLLNNYDYAFINYYGSNYKQSIIGAFNKSDINYLFYDSRNGWDYALLCNAEDEIISSVFFNQLDFFYNYYSSNKVYVGLTKINDGYYDPSLHKLVGFQIFNANDYIYPGFITDLNYINNPRGCVIYRAGWDVCNFNFNFYSKDGSPLIIFKDYKYLYDYLNGEGTYIATQFYEEMKGLQIQANELSQSTVDNLQNIYNAIKEQSANAMNQAELQEIIDNAISKKLDDITDNTTETNNKLDSILELLAEQNETLLDILGVTEYIAYNTTNSDGELYDMEDLNNTFNTMYTGLGNAVKYGVNTINEDGTVATPEAGLDMKNGLFGKFPFSVPYQLYDWLKALQAEAEAPTFKVNYGFLIGKKDDEAYVMTIDLKPFEPIADVCRSFLRLSFTLLLAIGIYNRFKGV